MIPTVDTDLDRLRQTLRRIASEETLSPEAVANLASLDQLLRLVERSWDAMVPHLRSELVHTGSAVADIVATLPPAVAARFADQVSAMDLPGADGAGRSTDELVRAGQQARAVLSKLISESGDLADPRLRAALLNRAAAGMRAALESRPW